jgi:hypothetical protein
MVANFALYFNGLARRTSARALLAAKTIEMGAKTGQKASGTAGGPERGKCARLIKSPHARDFVIDHAIKRERR